MTQSYECRAEDCSEMVEFQTGIWHVIAGFPNGTTLATCSRGHDQRRVRDERGRWSDPNLVPVEPPV